MEITFSGKNWTSTKDLILKVYQKIGLKFYSGELKENEIFYYPELADALRENHYYLTPNHITPEHFIIEKDLVRSKGFRIKFYSSKFPSENKYREIEIQKNDNYPHKRALIQRGFEEYMNEVYTRWIHSRDSCERCKKPIINHNFQVYFEDFDLEEDLDEMLDRYSKTTLYYSFTYDIIQADHVELNAKNPIVTELKLLIDTTPHRLLCRSCLEKQKSADLWDELQDDTTTLNRISKILRIIVKDGPESQIQKLNTLLDAHINEPEATIPHHIQNIWQQMHFIAKNWYEYGCSKPVLEQWATYFEPPTDLNDWRAFGFGALLYRLDEENWNAKLTARLFTCSGNFFRFFRNIALESINSSVIEFLINKAQQENLDGIWDKLKMSIQGIIYTRQKNLLDLFIANFQKFNYAAQEVIISELAYLDLPGTFEQLKQKIHGDGSIQGVQPSFSPKLIQFFDEKAKIIETQLQTEKQAEEEYQKGTKQEEKELDKTYKLWKLTQESGNKMEDVAGKLINNKYRPAIQHHVNKYKADFETYFQSHKEPLVALDIEEWNHRMFCVLAIEIKPDLKVFVKMFAVEDIYPIERYTFPIKNKIRSWLKTLSTRYVISHGSNEEEVKMTRDSGHEQINTQDILHTIRMMNANYGRQIKGEGLKHFEEFIDFKRLGCPFLKHETPMSFFYSQVILSLDHHLRNTPQRTCEICKKEQDVLLYCLEDAFSSMLIYIYFANHEPGSIELR